MRQPARPAAQAAQQIVMQAERRPEGGGQQELPGPQQQRLLHCVHGPVHGDLPAVDGERLQVQLLPADDQNPLRRVQHDGFLVEALHLAHAVHAQPRPVLQPQLMRPVHWFLCHVPPSPPLCRMVIYTHRQGELCPDIDGEKQAGHRWRVVGAQHASPGAAPAIRVGYRYNGMHQLRL